MRVDKNLLDISCCQVSVSDAFLGEMVHTSRYLTGHHHQVLRGQHLWVSE